VPDRGGASGSTALAARRACGKGDRCGPAGRTHGPSPGSRGVARRATPPSIARSARLYGLSVAEATSRGERLLEQLELPGVWERQIKTLPGGQRRRLDIAMG
jgi:ABC-type Na+ transport system ATPase subunit NatA